MQIFPAIDLRGGQAVRLFQGDYGQETVYNSDPAAVARGFRAAGAKFLHVVDLDGARDGTLANFDSIAAIAKQGGLYIEVGGGIRTEDRVRQYLDIGVSRCILGTAAVKDFDFTARMARRYGDQIAVGVDARDGLVRTAGWVEETGLDCLTFARRMEELGAEYLIFTDIDTDGTLSGPPFGRLEALQNAVSCKLTASGGVSSNADLRALGDMGLYGAIVGKAWYTGAVDLKLAVEEGGPQ